MKKFFRKIQDSYFKSLRGEENFWVVLFGWGVGVYVGSVALGGGVLLMLTRFNIKIADEARGELFKNWIYGFPFAVLGPFGLIFAFIYPVVLTYSLIRTSRKFSYFRIFLVTLGAITFFYYVHFVNSVYKFITLGSILLTVISPLGWLSGLVLAIIAIKKTIQSLSTKTSK